MKILALGLFIMVFNLTLNAQTQINYNTLSSSGGGTATLDATLTGSPEIDGSPFFYKNWDNSGIIYINNGKKIHIKNINFNVEKSKFIFRLSKDSIFTFDNVNRVEINNKIFVKIKSKFYESLVSGKHGNLLKEYLVKIVPKVHKITNTVIGPGKYKKESKYFYYEEGVLKKIKLNKKSIIKVLGSEKVKILQYAKDYKLSFTKENDIIKVFKYYDTL